MENSPEKSSKRSGRSVPAWVLLLLVAVIILMMAVVLFLVLMHAGVISCGASGGKDAEIVQTAVTKEPQSPDDRKEELQTKISAPPTEPPKEAPTEEPTAEPTEEPTPEPTPTPTPEPTEVPDTFTLGGKKVKTGSTKIIGSKLGINGKSKKLTHITEEEVANLVALCPKLEELELDYCYMDDYTPLGELTKLTRLQLAYCGYTDPGNAITDIGWVKNLTNLTRLNLKYNKIDDTEPLAGLTKLTYLNLGSNPLEDEDLEPISNLKKLTTLYLYDGKKITDVGPLADLTNLTFLSIGRNSKLKNIKPLTSLSKLSSLRVYRTNISDISYFKNFKSLKKLDIAKCPILFLDYYKLEDCKKLRTIVLDQKDTDASLAIDDMINNGAPFEILYDW